MSCNRKVLADILHVDESEIKCETCGAGDNGKVFVNCKHWDEIVAAGAFCSLWLPKGVE